MKYLIIVALLLSISCKKNKTETYYYQSATTIGYTKVCIDNHEFIVTGGSATSLTPNIDDNGKPIRCISNPESHPQQ